MPESQQIGALPTELPPIGSSAGVPLSTQPLPPINRPASDSSEKAEEEKTEEEKTEEEKTEEEKPEKEKEAMVDSLQTVPDVSVGAILALGNGAAMPLFSLFFGALVDAFSASNGSSEDEVMDEVVNVAFSFVYLAIGTFICSWAELSCFMVAGQRQVRRLRMFYLERILAQDMGWCDTHNTGELTTRLVEDTLLVQAAFDKIGSGLHQTGMFIAGFLLGFINGWQLTLVLLGTFPFIAAAGAAMGMLGPKMAKQSQDAYAKAGAVADETLGAVKTVAVFSNEPLHKAKYAELLETAKKFGQKAGLVGGLGYGATMFVVFCSYAVAFWFGGMMVSNEWENHKQDRPWTGGDVVAVFFSIIMGGFALGQIQPATTAINKGRGALHRIAEITQRKPPIDTFDAKGEQPASCNGDISFEGLKFSYPSRPDQLILNNFTLHVGAGSRVALVGESGCGKSTTIALMQRFYDPSAGVVRLDGKDLRTLNIQWLRSHLGLVSQEPILFATSIADNIRLGRVGDTIAQQDIDAAARSANAHDFISQFPDGYNTIVGEKGAQLSGGQKQRVAIARAVLRNPRILLLDEATSALDTESERVVQEALDRVMEGRTTIVIAHRLSTIRNADAIAAIHQGVVEELGTHDELVARQGLYYRLARRQGVAVGDVGGVMSPTSAVSDDSPKDNVQVHEKKNDAANEPSKEEEKEEEEEMYKVSLGRVLALNKPVVPFLMLGILAAAANGLVYPFFAIIFSEVMETFQSADKSSIQDSTDYLAIMFCTLAAGSFVVNTVQQASFATVGETLTKNLRAECFDKMLRKDIGWFDSPKNAVGVLTSHLASDAALVKGASSDRFGLVAQNLSSLCAGLIIAFVTGWKLALVVLSTVPIVAAAGKIQTSFLTGSTDSQQSMDEASRLVAEAVGGFRTVVAFGLEPSILTRFGQNLEIPYKAGIRKSLAGGVAFAFSQGVQFLNFALCFWYGGYLVVNGEWDNDSKARDICLEDATYTKIGGTVEECMDIVNLGLGFGDFMTTFFALTMAAMGMGEAAQFAPDMAAATKAMSNIFKLLDSELPIDPLSESGIKPQSTVGELAFQGVTFTYPSRPDTVVLNSFSLQFPKGTMTALVGESGCGKSTVISLLQRFYDPSGGAILLDGADIRSLNVKWLRMQFGLVSQEPTLFAMTIADNIRYGAQGDGAETACMAAAVSANAHDFISQFPDGYNTYVGDKFTQLSGGQKQRVAIARAVLRNPHILLLDEATSALDTESERVVQEALDRVMLGRTTIVIAHRLSTIRNADAIAVVKQGQVAELGKHDELLARGGLYTQLAQRQT